jgi:hypothetical protein
MTAAQSTDDRAIIAIHERDLIEPLSRVRAA